MYVPFVFTMDALDRTGDYMHWAQFYLYAAACIKSHWPMISHERYFSRFAHVEEIVFGMPLRAVLANYGVENVPTTAEMLALKAYPVPQVKEDALIAPYASPFDCWVDLLNHDNVYFEHIIGELLDCITADFKEKPEGVLAYEYLPKALLRAANKRGIPVIFQVGGIVRPPFAKAMNACSLNNTDSADVVKEKYDRFLPESQGVPMLSRKGLLRIFVSEQYMADVHNIDDTPEYDVGVLYNNLHIALYHAGQAYVPDQELSARAKEKYDKVLIRTRPGCEPTADALDNSPACFHFCCKCKHVVGFYTKGMFEAMLAGRIPHEYGSFLFHAFCNEGIEDDSKAPVSVAFLNFVLFGLCTPFSWLTNPEELHFILSNTSEKERYLRGFHHYTQGISNEDLELYYMTDGRAYRLGDPLYFTSGHKPHEYAAYYCLGGLHFICELCTWSNGETTSFAFDITEPVTGPLTISTVLYEVAMDCNGANPAQTVTCEVNGVACGSNTLTPGKKYLRFTIPAECLVDNSLMVTFRYGYLHASGDAKLAVAFERMYISRAVQRAIEEAMSDEIAALTNQTSALEAQNAVLHGQINALDAQNATLHAHIGELEAQIQAIYGSRSWKIANGMRKTAAMLIPRKK